MKFSGDVGHDTRNNLENLVEVEGDTTEFQGYMVSFSIVITEICLLNT